MELRQGIYRNLIDGKSAIAFGIVTNPEGEKFALYGSLSADKILPIAQFLQEWELAKYLEFQTLLPGLGDK